MIPVVIVSPVTAGLHNIDLRTTGCDNCQILCFPPLPFATTRVHATDVMGWPPPSCHVAHSAAATATVAVAAVATPAAAAAAAAAVVVGGGATVPSEAPLRLPSSPIPALTAAAAASGAQNRFGPVGWGPPPTPPPPLSTALDGSRWLVHAALYRGTVLAMAEISNDMPCLYLSILTHFVMRRFLTRFLEDFWFHHITGMVELS